MPQSQTTKAPVKKSKAATITDWKLTNNTDTDLVVMDAYASDDQSLPAEQLYQQALQLLKTSDAQQIVKAGTSASFQLSGAHLDAGGDAQQAEFYSIIVAKAGNYFPVKVVDLKPDSSNAYASVTVTDDDVKNMQMAEKFQQSLMAFPSSEMAQAFTKALAEEDITKADTYLQSTKDYKSLTVDMVAAVTTYYNRFPFAWADYAKTKTYSLYTSDGVSNKYMGAVTLKNRAATPPVITGNGIEHYTISLENATGSSTETLHYANGKFVNGSASVSLQGLFTLKSELTGLDTDNILIPLFMGSMDNTAVFGYDDASSEMVSAKVSEEKNVVETALDHVLHPKNTQDWLIVGSLIAAGVLAIGGLIIGVRKVILSRRKLKADADQKAIEEQQQRERQAARERAASPEGRAALWEDMKSKQDVFLTEQNRSLLRDMVKQQHEYLSQVSKHSNNPDLQDVFDALIESGKIINESTRVELSAGMKEVIKDLKTSFSVLEREASTAREHATDREVKDMEKSSEAIRKTSSKVDNIERNRDEWAKNEIPEIEG